MGQPINVVEKSSPRPGVARFETDRWLTGMGHERFESVDDIVGNRTVDELARRLFATGAVQRVHVSGHMITVQMTPEGSSGPLLDVIRGLHIRYPDQGDEQQAAPSSVQDAAFGSTYEEASSSAEESAQQEA